LSRETYSKVLEAVLIFVVVAGPLPFGAVQPWGYKSLASVIFLMAFLWVVKALSSGGFSFIRTPLLYFAPLFLVFSILQAIPLPAPLVEVVEPGRAAMRAAAGATGSFDTLALYPWKAVSQSFHLLSAALLFFLAANITATKESVNRVTAALIGAGALLGILLFAQKALIAGKSTLPFINKNHFAAYMELLIPVAAGRLAYWQPDRRKRSDGFIARLLRLVSGNRAWVVAGLALAMLVMVASVIHTMSRGGLIGMTFSFVVLFSLMFRDKKRAVVMLGITAVLVAAALAWASQEKLGERMMLLSDIKENSSSMVRLNVWKDTLDISAGYPVTGVGMGGFEAAYPYYKKIMMEINVNQPEDDYLYLLSETGILGLLMAVSFVFMFLARVLKGIFSRGDRFFLSVATGGVASLGALLVHGVVDTGLHMPGILLSLAVVMGLVFSVVHQPGADGADAADAARERVSFKGRPTVKKIFIAAVVIFSLLALRAGIGAVADLYYVAAEAQRADIQKDGNPTRARLDRIARMYSTAAAIERGSSEYNFEKGRAYSMLADYALAHKGDPAAGDDLRDPAHYYEQAYRAFAVSAGDNPYSSFAHLMAGRMLEKGLGEKKMGEAEYAIAYRLNPTSPYINKYLAGYYEKNSDVEKAREYAGKVPYLDPKYNPIALRPVKNEFNAHVGETVRWTATTKYPVTGMEYSFRLWYQGGGWVVQRPYSPSNTWDWDTSGMKEGSYNVVVWTRNADQKVRGARFNAPRAFVLGAGGDG